MFAFILNSLSSLNFIFMHFFTVFKYNFFLYFYTWINSARKLAFVSRIFLRLRRYFDFFLSLSFYYCYLGPGLRNDSIPKFYKFHFLKMNSMIMITIDLLNTFNTLHIFSFSLTNSISFEYECFLTWCLLEFPVGIHINSCR